MEFLITKELISLGKGALSSAFSKKVQKTGSIRSSFQDSLVHFINYLRQPVQSAKALSYALLKEFSSKILVKFPSKSFFSFLLPRSFKHRKSPLKSNPSTIVFFRDHLVPVYSSSKVFERVDLKRENQSWKTKSLHREIYFKF